MTNRDKIGRQVMDIIGAREMQWLVVRIGWHNGASTNIGILLPLAVVICPFLVKGCVRGKVDFMEVVWSDTLESIYHEVGWKVDKQSMEEQPDNPMAEKAFCIVAAIELSTISLIWSGVNDGEPEAASGSVLAWAYNAVGPESVLWGLDLVFLRGGRRVHSEIMWPLLRVANGRRKWGLGQTSARHD